MMATTVEITVGGIILFVNTFAIIVSYFVGNAILAPILNFAASFPIHPSLKSSMWETSYIYPAFFSFLIILEVVSIIGFVYILARRQVTPYEY
jgi:hypothetical protein